jgi:hypothetical protein
MWNLGKLQVFLGGSWPAHGTRESFKLPMVQGIGFLFLLLSQ